MAIPFLLSSFSERTTHRKMLLEAALTGRVGDSVEAEEFISVDIIGCPTSAAIFAPERAYSFIFGSSICVCT
jgi:hypothetical protein